MDLHFVGTANVFVYYPYWKKARSAPADYVHGSVVRQQVDGIFIVQSNCPRRDRPGSSTAPPGKTLKRIISAPPSIQPTISAGAIPSAGRIRQPLAKG